MWPTKVKYHPCQGSFMTFLLPPASQILFPLGLICITLEDIYHSMESGDFFFYRQGFYLDIT